MCAPVQLLLWQINKVSHTFTAAKIKFLHWHFFHYFIRRSLYCKPNKDTCSTKLWGPVPWWRETGRGGRRWSSRWCRLWGRCWSSWAHCLWSWWQSMFSPGLQDSLLLALVVAAPLLTRLWARTLKLSAVAPTLRVWAGRGDSSPQTLP